MPALTEAWPVLFALSAAALVLLLVLIVLLIRRTDRLRRRIEKSEQLTLEALSERSRDYMTRDELSGLLNGLYAQLLQEEHELDRGLALRLNRMDERLDGAAQADHQRSGQLYQLTDERLARVNKNQEQLLKLVDEQLLRNAEQLNQISRTLSENVSALREENSKKLDEMRQVVDEKLHQTLEKRLSESFRLVSTQLETVARGLGEMRQLASGVGDLKKVLTNVKTRGIWGEVQLGALLRQMLTDRQYEENAEVVPGSGRRVEYAVLLPGHDDQRVCLPIDSKFPMEPYERLLSASAEGGQDEVRLAEKALADAVLTEAKRIAGKYIEPPHTTDFAVMFLPTEGLYAEVLRNSALAETMQTRYHILPAGPTTLTALLSSLQVGFRTLQVEERSAEVWKMLSLLRTDFARFSDLLAQTQNRLRQAAESLDKAALKTKTIETHLRRAEEAPGALLPGMDGQEQATDKEE